MTKLDAMKKQFSGALARLDEIVREEKTTIVRDAAIKRFEFTFDLSWKLMRAFLEEHKGITCVSPKECIREAFHYGAIGEDVIWTQLTDLHNAIAHEYSEEFANDLFAKLPEIFVAFKKLKEATQAQS